MNYSIAGSLFLLTLLATNTQANSSLFSVDNTYLECSIVFENTGDLNRLEACTSAILKELNQITIDERNRSGLLNKKAWQATNLSLNKHLELCESNALKSQKNSTIKKDILSCRFFHLRSLAFEASSIK